MKELVRQTRLIRDLRQHLLPRRIPQLPGWRLAVRHTFGRSSGTDFYDFVSLPDGRLLMLMADGSGQKAPAPALVAILRVVMRSFPFGSGQERLPDSPLEQQALQPPHNLLGQLNRVLAENSLEEQYMNAFCASIAPRDGTVLYANAGHIAPRCWRAATQTIEAVSGPAGMPIGLSPVATYHQRRLELAPGDLLMLASEEILAARSSWGEAFGTDALDAATASAAMEGPEAVADVVMHRVERFLGRNRPAGDLTLLVVQREPECAESP